LAQAISVAVVKGATRRRHPAASRPASRPTANAHAPSSRSSLPFWAQVQTLGACRGRAQLDKIRLRNAAFLSTTHKQGTRGEFGFCKVSSLPLITYTIPPTNSLAFLFSSLIPTVYRPAASTARHFSSPLHPSSSPHKFFIFSSCTRTYASAPKKKKMPPKLEERHRK
jgi:hypothetical protein